jgi:hypothetical protein
VPTAKDIEARKGAMPSKSLYWHTFGSLNNALKQAGFDVPVGEERLERAVEQGAALSLRSGRLPKCADWAQARRTDPSMLTEWQVYRMFDARRGAWSTFQYLIRKRLEQRGVSISPEGAATSANIEPSSSAQTPEQRSTSSRRSQRSVFSPTDTFTWATAAAPGSASPAEVNSSGAFSVTAAQWSPEQIRSR